jgi:hypothetical protein
MIAALAGASPETVRAVRARSVSERPTFGAEVCSPADAGSLPAGAAVAALFSCTHADEADESGVARTRPRLEEVWTSDPALLACGDGGEFARWFDSNNVDDQWHHYVWAVPVGRIYDIVDESRRRAASWTAFASLLESRTR